MFEFGGGGINVVRVIVYFGGSVIAIFSAGGAIGEYLVLLLADENVFVVIVEVKDWIR